MEAEIAPESTTADRFLKLPFGSFGLQQDHTDYNFAFIK